jgi:hypothetical protein
MTCPAEWYFAPESLVAVSLFYKDIDSFVQTIRETRPFTDNPLGILTASPSQLAARRRAAARRPPGTSTCRPIRRAVLRI